MPDNETKTLTLHVEGQYADGSQISLDNLSLPLLKTQMECIYELLSNDDSIKKDARISLEEGSLKTLLILPVAIWSGLCADIEKYSIGDYSSISVPKRKKALDKLVRSSNVGSCNLSILSDDKEIYNSSTAITPRKQDIEVELEMDIEGKVLEAGGRGRPNIHVEGQNGKKYTITTSQAQIAELEKNILYHNVLLLVSYKYNIQTKASRDYRLKKIIDDGDSIKADELKVLIKQESAKWKNITDPALWLTELRGEIEE